jgi:hypothetical protein
MPIRAYAYTNNHNVVTASQLHFLKSEVILIKYLVIPWFDLSSKTKRLCVSININVAEQLCILVGIFFLGFYIEQASMEFYFHIVLPSSPSIPNYKTFWLFKVHCFYYVSRHSVYVSVSQNLCTKKAKTSYHLK